MVTEPSAPSSEAIRRDQVVVDDAQVAPAHMRRIEIIGERERVMTFQPAVVGMAALFGFANGQHGWRSLVVVAVTA
jgi:hypothetical protein